jgi:glycosyltransferase involved in cell wall biosynthesis
MINKQVKLDIEFKDKDFIILNFSLFLSDNDIKYYFNKNNINFRIKNMLNSNNEILNSYNFYKSNIFLNLNIDKKTKNIFKFSFKLYKKEIYDIKKITFGLCEENISWNDNFEISFFLKNSFFNTTNIIIDFYKDILNRAPDKPGFDYFYSNLSRNNLSISDFKNLLINSDENLKNIKENGITFLSRIDDKDSLLRIPIMFSYFGKNYFNSNIYDNSNLNKNIDNPEIKNYICNVINKNIYKNIICFDFTIDLNSINQKINKYRYSMYEADDIAIEWVRQFKSENLKKIIVPNEWCKEIYSKYFENVSVVPLGTHNHNITASNNYDVFTFGYIARFESRKNHKLLINAFKKRFLNNPKFQLKIHGPLGHNYNEILSLCNNVDNIKITSNLMSNDDLEKWWSDINCYVMPSSGEGFSHTPREAIMRGIPTIVSNYSAHESLVKLGFVRYFSPIDIEGAYKAVLFNREVGKHAIFDVDDLAKEMDYVINNYKDLLKISLIGRKYLIENESWEICSNKLMDVVYEK